MSVSRLMCLDSSTRLKTLILASIALLRALGSDDGALESSSPIMGLNQSQSRKRPETVKILVSISGKATTEPHTARFIIHHAFGANASYLI